MHCVPVCMPGCAVHSQDPQYEGKQLCLNPLTSSFKKQSRHSSKYQITINQKFSLFKPLSAFLKNEKKMFHLTPVYFKFSKNRSKALATKRHMSCKVHKYKWHFLALVTSKLISKANPRLSVFMMSIR